MRVRSGQPDRPEHDEYHSTNDGRGHSAQQHNPQDKLALAVMLPHERYGIDEQEDGEERQDSETE